MLREEERLAHVAALSVAELDDSALRQAVIGDMTKAKGMGQITKEAGVGRESLYKSLDRNGNPSFQTIMKVVHALGGRLTIQPAQAWLYDQHAAAVRALEKGDR